MIKNYDENSIKVFAGLEGCRKRPSMYIGDVNSNGLHQLVFELLDNSLDEAVAGHCNKIDIFFNNDGSIKISDNGRGIPVKPHPTEKISTLDVVMTMLHSGGKFDNDENSAFLNSSGTHGVGASVVNALSEWFVVEVKRDGFLWQRKYEKGIPTDKNISKVSKVKKKDTGTTITFLPDYSIFTCKQFDKLIIQKRLQELCFLNPNVNFSFSDEKYEKNYFSKDGLVGYINYLLEFNKRKSIHKISGFNGKIDGCDVDLSFVYDDTNDSKIYTYANNIATTDGGIHQNAALDAIVKIITEKADSELKKHNINIVKSDVLEGLIMVMSVRLQNPEFYGQTKTRLNNENLRKPLGDFLQKAFDILFKKHRDIANSVIDKVISTAAAKHTNKKAKAIQRKKSLLEMDFLASKLKDCTSNDPKLCELFLVEGDSAAGGMIEARNRQYQAILPLRGKVMNVFNQSLNRVLENDEIRSIISSLGITIQNNNADISNLKYNKIILSCDADPDGGHIVCLLLTLFYKFMRKLIENGHLYICETPLFRIIHKGKSIYIKNDLVLQEYKQKHTNDKIEISRFKGLGEMNVTELRETIMNESSRILRRVLFKDKLNSSNMIETLMGKDPNKRRDFLNNYLYFNEKETE